MWTKITAIVAMATATAIVGIGIFTLLTRPQILSEAKPVEPRLQTAPIVQSMPAPPGSVKPNWKVRCANVQGELSCYARQSIYRAKTKRPLVTVVVRVSHDTEQPELLVTLPLGIYLPAGASLQIGNVPPKALTLWSCDLNGCLAKGALSEPELAAMLEGRRIKIAAQDQKRERLTYRLSVAGFSEAFTKMK